MVCHKWFLFFISLWLTAYNNQANAQEEVERLYRMAMQAYDEGNHQAYLGNFISIQAILPESPVVWAHLARAWSLNAGADSAAKYLIKRNKLILDPEFNEHNDLSYLHASMNWKDIEDILAELARPIGKVDTAFVLSEDLLHPESIAFDPRDSVWLIGDVRTGYVAKVDDEGEEVYIPPGDQGLAAVMGLCIDSKNQHFFASSVQVPEWKDFREGSAERSSIYVYHVKDGLFMHKIDHFDASNDHVFGDLIIYKDGTAFISDSYQPLIFRLDSEQGLREHIRSQELKSPQGMAFHEDSALLYVADYSRGIVVFDLFTGEFQGRTLETPTHSLKGIDGIYWYNGQLIAIQNGSIPKRVLKLKLSPDGKRIVGSSPLISGYPVLNEPTQGVIHNNDFYFIANSPWPFYEDRTELNLPSTFRAVILKCALNEVHE
jgi:sugar lactone lactonase YvrE